MFRGVTDIPNGLAVWLFTEGQNTEEDWRAYCDALGSAYREFAGQRHPFAVQVIDPRSSDPTAKWRREIAEASARVPKGSAIAIVSQSRIVRGVITAVSWLRPSLYALHVVATEREACALADVGSKGRGARAAELIAQLRRADSFAPPSARST